MKPKILIRIGTLRHGGAEKVLIELLKNLPPEKYEIDLLLDIKLGKYLDDVPQWVNLIALKERGNFYPENNFRTLHRKALNRMYFDVLKLFPNIIYKHYLKGKKYDLELCANDVLWPEMKRSPLKSKKVVWVHKNPSSRYPNPERAEQKIREMLQADALLCISEKILEEFKEFATPEQQRKIIHFYNPIDFQEIINKVPPSSHISLTPNKIVAIGTVYPHKGFDRLLAAHDRLLKEGIQNEVAVVGDGYDFENLKKAVEKMNREDTFILHGFQKNPYPFMADASIFCLSSRAEGFPTVLIEALLMKKMIVATDVSGVRELLEDGKYGILVQSSEEGVYQGLKEILTNCEKQNQLKANLQNHQFGFNLQSSVNHFTTVVDDLIKA